MPSPTTPTSRDSRTSSRHIALEVRPSLRARLLWGLFACVMLAALCFAPLPPESGGPEWPLARYSHVLGRLLAAAMTLIVGGCAAMPILFGRGTRAVRSFVWAVDGSWRLERPDGSWEQGTLLPATATLGPWILLVWRAEGAAAWKGRRYALLDVWASGAPDCRALRGRLKLEAAAFRRRNTVIQAVSV